MQEALKERVSEVRISRRLTESPACLVSGEHEMGAHMERILKAAGQKITASKPTLEINPDHPLLQRMEGESDTGRFADWSQIICDQALLAEGGRLEDPAAFVKKLNRMFLSLGV